MAVAAAHHHRDAAPDSASRVVFGTLTCFCCSGKVVQGSAAGQHTACGTRQAGCLLGQVCESTNLQHAILLQADCGVMQPGDAAEGSSALQPQCQLAGSQQAGIFSLHSGSGLGGSLRSQRGFCAQHSSLSRYAADAAAERTCCGTLALTTCTAQGCKTPAPAGLQPSPAHRVRGVATSGQSCQRLPRQ